MPRPQHWLEPMMLVIIGLLISFETSPVRAETLDFTVTMGTAPLQGSSSGPFYLDWALSGSDGNKVVIGNFNFGVGGAPGSTASILEIGDASGDISIPNENARVDSSGGYQVNDFSQGFTPGDLLIFQVKSTEMPGGTDAFLFSIYDGNNKLLPTQGPNSEFLSITYNGGTPIISNFGSAAIGISAPTVTFAATPAPLPTTAQAGLFLFAVGAFFAGRSMKRERRRILR